LVGSVWLRATNTAAAVDATLALIELEFLASTLRVATVALTDSVVALFGLNCGQTSLQKNIDERVLAHNAKPRN